MNNARKKTMVIVMLAAALICGQGLFANGAPEQGVGQPTAVEFENANFDSVSISGIEDFEVIMGDEFSVTVMADENIIENVEVVQRGATLEIALPEAYAYNPTVLEAVIEVPGLEELNVSAKSHGVLSGAQIPVDIEIAVTDGSSLEIENLIADKAMVEVSVDSILTGTVFADDISMRVYSSDVDVTGETGALYCFADDDSEVNINDLYITDALLDFHNDTEGEISFKDYEGTTSHTIVKLYDDTDISLATMGDLNDDAIYDDAELN